MCVRACVHVYWHKIADSCRSWQLLLRNIMNHVSCLKTSTPWAKLKQQNTVMVIWHLRMWFKDARTQTKFQFLVQQYATWMGKDDFWFGDGWLHSFKCSYNDTFYKINGASGDVTTERTDQWTTITLPKLVHDYNPHVIFKTDESGLFYNLLPNKLLMLNEDSHHGGKWLKDWLNSPASVWKDSNSGDK